MADRFGGDAVALEDLPAQLVSADVVVASTASPHPILGVEDLEQVMRARDHRPLLLVDIAVPRDIDPACSDIEGVELYDMDDLQAAVAHTMSVREAEALRAEAIVEEEIQRFAAWLGSFAVQPTIRALREYGDAIVEQVLSENAGRWEQPSERDVERIEAVARSVMKRVLHEPTLHLRTLGDGRSHGRLQITRELFGLEGVPDAEPADGAGPDGRANVRPLPRRASGS
jgi:glutamyl-tRNA reductase